MIHVEGIEKIPEKYLAEFKTKSVYEIIEKWRTDNKISPINDTAKIKYQKISRTKI